MFEQNLLAQGIANVNFGYAALKTINNNIKKINSHTKSFISDKNNSLYYKTSECINKRRYKNMSVSLSKEIEDKVKHMKNIRLSSNLSSKKVPIGHSRNNKDLRIFKKDYTDAQYDRGRH